MSVPTATALLRAVPTNFNEFSRERKVVGTLALAWRALALPTLRVRVALNSLA